MRGIALSVIIFLCLSVSVAAQDMLWSRTYGGSAEDQGSWVQQTRDGGYIVTGFFGAGDTNVYLIKTDSLGDTLWSRSYGGSSWDCPLSGQQTADGGYVVVGYTESFGAGGYYDVYLIKTDSLGDTLWSRTYGGSGIDYGNFVQQTTDGGYIVVGYTESFGDVYGDVYLVKTDSLGDALWSRTYGGSHYEYGWSVQQTTDGGYIVVGHTGSFGPTGHNVYLIKTDSLGDTLWTRVYLANYTDYGNSVQQTSDGGYIVAGWTMSFGAGGEDVYLIKTDSLGHPLWIRTYGGSSGDFGFSVQQTSDGGYIVAGLTCSFGAGYYGDAYVIKTDSLGDTLWTRTYGDTASDGSYSVQQTTDGGYIVGGTTQSFGAGSFDLMLTKLDSQGNTCIGEFVTSTVMSVSCSVSSPATVVNSPPTIVTSPATEVTSPPTQITTVCEEGPLVCGDVNGDGGVNITDIVYFIDYLLKSGPSPLCPPEPYASCADCNGDGDVTISDIVYLINYVLKSGDPPIC
jgi:hypothetical protein